MDGHRRKPTSPKPTIPALSARLSVRVKAFKSHVHPGTFHPPFAAGTWACSTRPRDQLTRWRFSSYPLQTTRSAHAAAILLAPPPTQQYFTGAVTAGMSDELRYHVPSGMGARRKQRGVSGELQYRVPNGMGDRRAASAAVPSMLPRLPFSPSAAENVEPTLPLRSPLVSGVASMGSAWGCT